MLLSYFRSLKGLPICFFNTILYSILLIITCYYHINNKIILQFAVLIISKTAEEKLLFYNIILQIIFFTYTVNNDNITYIIKIHINLYKSIYLFRR